MMGKCLVRAILPLACEQALQLWWVNTQASSGPHPVAVMSPFASGSRMTSRAYPKLTACSMATVPSLKENMTKTQVENCVAIDATIEQTQEIIWNITYTCHLTCLFSNFTECHSSCNFNDRFLRMKDQRQHATKLTVLVASKIKRHNLKCCHFRKFLKKNNILHPAPNWEEKVSNWPCPQFVSPFLGFKKDENFHFNYSRDQQT